MAGIGFVLRKLYNRDDLSGLASACLHSAFASTGPWLCAVLALGTISYIDTDVAGLSEVFKFRVILIYNLSFSLVIAGPVLMIATRYLSDSIYNRDVSGAPGLLLGSILLVWTVGLMITGPFYLLYTNLEPEIAISAIINFILLITVWISGLFISAMRNYALITRAFIVGMGVAILSSYLLSQRGGAAGILNGFSFGLTIISAILIGNLLAEYPYSIQRPFAFLPYFRKYWELALSGLAYNAAIWVDKWIMWLAPEAIRLPSNMVVYPVYDSAMFLAYLTTVPAMALFLFSAETNFFEHYSRYYNDIEKKAPFAKIQKNHAAIMRAIFGSSRNFFILQGSLAILSVVMAPSLISLIKGNYVQIGMLRYGLIGAFFQVLTLFLIVLLIYFGNRKACFQVQTLFFVSNAVFTFASLHAGFPYYGLGYFASTFLTFLVTSWVTYKYVHELPYHTFITSNASIIAEASDSED